MPVSSASMGYFRSGGFYFRVGAVGMLVVAIFGVLGLRLWSLQFLHGPEYTRLARRQTFRMVDLPTPRGPILDAKGRVLVESEGRLALTVDALRLGTVSRNGRWWQPTPAGRLELRRVAALTGRRLPVVLGNVRRSVARSPYAPAVAVARLPRDLAFYFQERAARFPDFRVTAFPDREYPQGAFGSEFLGLLGQVTEQQLEAHPHRYRPGEVIGQTGVEAAHDRLLNPGLQRARVAVDSRGRPIGPPRLLRAARSPHALRLSIDARFQRQVEHAVRDGIAFAHQAGHADANAGAAVVMNPRTGAVYALASYPTFNEAAAARDPGYLERLLRGRVPGLVSRATQGLYPLGSTFKPIVAAAALDAGLISPYSALPCTSTFSVGNHVFHNVEAGVNASLTLRQALSISCDTWFYRLGAMFYLRNSLGMQNWARRLGLGRLTGIDVPGESAGVIPTPAWLKRTYTQRWQRIWYEGYSVNLAIGQGQLAVTPLQLAVAYSALANGGKIVRPHVADALVSPRDEIVRRLRFPARRHVAIANLWAIREGLFMAAHEGTSASVFSDFPIPVAGKTGTAETGNGNDHSWYASWAPSGNPRVVVVVVIEHGGFGVEAAAPAAREIYQHFFGIHAPPATSTTP
jgi:penicillin-binding protein 2